MSDVHPFSSILLNAWDDFHRISATFATEPKLIRLQPADIATEWQIDAIIKSVIHCLLPSDWSSRHTSGCVAAFCFLKVTLSIPLESVTPCSLSFQELSLSQLFQRVGETLSVRNEADCANDLILPPVAHALGLLSELLHDSSKRQLINRIIEFLHPYWKPFGSLLIKICSSVIIKQSGLPTDEQERILNLSEPALFDLLRSIHSLVWEARNAQCTRPVYECLIVALLAGDDAHLFHGLTLWLQLENCLLVRSRPGDDQCLLDLVPNAHQLFASLARTIGYSPHLLVDWIVSPETSCLSYLVHYLRRFRSSDSLGSEPVNSRAAPPLGTDWPATQLGNMLDKLARCLQTLESTGSIPFSPQPLIRSLNHAVSVIQTSTLQIDPHAV
ncbi:hypothetical protein P879_04181 [Paragonimus westermani]|uniref:Protein Lines N-terminal domain-containing protein n=1 Tax=Paragonimus westermani TaxID=34504 RepID=A0A8T0DWP2_9TREM|nr:hypothetical protein P879_04181 [Paragonimus westermani]